MSKSDLLPIEHRVHKTLREYFKEIHRLKFIVGVSGGPDSMCLLYVLKKLNVEGLVVHINYGKRGEESNKDAELVEQIAYQWGFDCQTLTVDPQQASGQNFQQWARTVRYDIFRALAAEHQADGIAVAHHEDDQVETILQKQFRGAGLASWSGMEVWDGELFRPLLTTTRQEIEEYISRESIPYRIDKSNLEPDFARNFLRNEWLPELEAHFPGWRQNVLRTAEQASLFGEAVEWILGQLKDRRGRIARKHLLSLRPRLQKAVILQELKRVQPGVNIGGNTLDELDKIDQLQTGKSLQLTDKLTLMRDREHYEIVERRDWPDQLLELSREQIAAGFVVAGTIELKTEVFEQAEYDRHLYLDADKISWPLKLRRWKDGDRFQPFGMDGHQKVSDHLTNRKISAVEKNRAIILQSFEDTVCAVIFPPKDHRVPPGTISELFRCDENTRRCLTIKRIR